MQNLELAGSASVLMFTAGLMVLYERLRQKSERPLFSGRETITLYWMSYLALSVLAATCGVAAIVR